MQLEFGKLPPSFLPLGGKRLYEYQIKLFQSNNYQIFLSLPKSFSINPADKQRLDSLGINLIFVQDNLSLGESVLYCLNSILPLNESLQILHGDTFLQHIANNENTLGISKANNNYDWAYLQNNKKLDFEITNPQENIDDFVLNGYFHIKEPYFFIKCLSETRCSFLESLKLYSKTYPFTLSKSDCWFDFGLLSSYFHSKKDFTTQRAFNDLVIQNNFVNKKSSFHTKITAEIHWFKHFPKELSLFIPRFIQKDDRSYQTEYLYLNTLSELFVFAKLPVNIWRQIFIALREFLRDLHSYKSKDSHINFDYKHKSLLRLTQFSQENNIDLTQTWNLTINGRFYHIPSILEILKILDTFVEKTSDFVFIHGDFCLSNIMFDFKSKQLKVIDPRGLDFNSQITLYGDSRYDFAKLLHSVFGLYDFIVYGFYECKLHDNHIILELHVSNEIQEIQKEFFTLFDMIDMKEIKAITIHLFLSMLPLHHDDIKRQYAFLANAFWLFIDLMEQK